MSIYRITDMSSGGSYRYVSWVNTDASNGLNADVAIGKIQLYGLEQYSSSKRVYTRGTVWCIRIPGFAAELARLPQASHLCPPEVIRVG